jgi:hypothetical protein
MNGIDHAKKIPVHPWLVTGGIFTRDTIRIMQLDREFRHKPLALQQGRSFKSMGNRRRLRQPRFATAASIHCDLNLGRFSTDRAIFLSVAIVSQWSNDTRRHRIGGATSWHRVCNRLSDFLNQRQQRCSGGGVA